MPESWTKQTAIVGIGQTEFSKNSGRSEMQLAVEASKEAIDDAGLSPSDIDGLVTFTLDRNDEMALCRALSIDHLEWASRTPFGGGGSNLTVRHAAAAVASGAAKHVLIYRAFNERSGHRYGQPAQAVLTPTQNWRIPWGLDTPAKVYSLGYQRYMHDYGVTNEDFGRYTVIARRHAATNPRAWFYNRPITLEDHQASRWIVEPVIRLLDCCQESDGGVSIIITTAERAKDLRAPGVRIEGISQKYSVGGTDIMPDYLKLRRLDRTADGKKLWDELGASVDDVQVATIYENFTPTVFQALEFMGVCGPGEAKDFIADGHIELNGSFPVNTNGGLLGEGYIHGMNNITEIVRQVRGTAVNQVPNVERGLVNAGGCMLLGKM